MNLAVQVDFIIWVTQVKNALCDEADIPDWNFLRKVELTPNLTYSANRRASCLQKIHEVVGRITTTKDRSGWSSFHGTLM